MTFNWLKPTLHTLTDEELMQRVARNDDERAFDELYHRHARRLMGFLYRQLWRDEERAADLMQDVFLRLWEHRTHYLAEASFRPWLYSIACNLCKNEYRHLEHRSQWEEEVRTTVSEAAADDQIVQMQDRQFREALASIIESLTAEARMLYALRFEEELTVPQIASVMELPEGTVKSRLHALVQHLKNQLRPYGKI